MDRDKWQGLSVRTRDGYTLGMAVGVFTDRALADRLRVQGDDPRAGQRWRLPVGAAVYAIPPHAVLRREQDSLLLDTSLAKARSRWLMHVLRTRGA